ncbi:MAG: PaaI family thioesterase [Sphingosinicella sp.]
MKHGVTPLAEVIALSGLEFLTGMIAGRYPPPPIARTMGFRLTEVEHGRAVFEAEPTDALLNPLGAVHGGLGLTLIDSAAGCALHTMLEPGYGYTTVETKANFVRPIATDAGKLRCEGHSSAAAARSPPPKPGSPARTASCWRMAPRP